MKRKIMGILVCMLAVATSTVVVADWVPGDGHKMHWPQTPKSGGWDIEFSVRLADDWMCSETGPVTDIHFWVSWMQDIQQAIEIFTVTIWSDWPAGAPGNPYPYSVPRAALWSRDFREGQFTQSPQELDLQGWFDPYTGEWGMQDHSLWDQVNIDSIPDPFIQQEDSIYWLEVDFWGQPFAGWKETDQNWNDDAVFWDFPDWLELRDPIEETTIDLAFVITSQVDCGDAPDGPYPTLLASNGARHSIMPGIFLGSTIDPEADGQPDVDALGDDNDGNDDEDGVVFLSLVHPDSAVNVKVTASVPGNLDAWVDFNGDGDWADAGEQIFNSVGLVAGANFLVFTVPTSATVATTYSRFRFSTAGGLSYTGLASDGEVEDYRVFIQEPTEDCKMHWPQLPDLDSTGMDVDMYWTPLADDWFCIDSGPVTDIHLWGSFADDILPAGGVDSMTFDLAIHANIPAGVIEEWSMPGEMLWTQRFGPGEYEVHQKTDNNPEDWYAPETGLWRNDNHLQVYQYNFYIDASEAFVQDSGTIYWLSVKDVLPVEPDYTFGWKTTRIDLRWNDDATWLADPPVWWPLTYPDGHEYEFETLDLAFVITGGAECPCGDCNGDGRITVADATYIVSFIYRGGPGMVCDCDVNLDGRITIADATYIVSYIYRGGPPPCNPPLTAPSKKKRMER